MNTRLEIESVALEREVRVQECSALNGQGIWEGIDQLILMFEERKLTNAQKNTQGQEMESASTNKESKNGTTKESEK